MDDEANSMAGFIAEELFRPQLKGKGSPAVWCFTAGGRVKK